MGWVASGGSHRGAAHVRRSEPSEDSHRIGVVGSTVVLAMADGHGSTRCARARLGADFAVDAMYAVLGEDPPVAACDVAARVVSAWRHAVDADLVAHQPDAAETARVAGAHRVLYGTTAIGVSATTTVLRVVQIGDGDVVLGERGATTAIRHAAPSVPGPGAETFSLCDADPEAHFGVTDYDLDRVEIDIVLAATDGLGSAYGDPDWHDVTLSDLRTRLGDMATAELQHAVEGWCTAPAETGGDDTTIAVLARHDLFASGPQETT